MWADCGAVMVLPLAAVVLSSVMPVVLVHGCLPPMPRGAMEGASALLRLVLWLQVRVWVHVVWLAAMPLGPLP